MQSRPRHGMIHSRRHRRDRKDVNMTRDELNKLIADGETVHLECKLAKNAIPANFWETYSSFANTDGGTILLGVKVPFKIASDNVTRDDDTPIHRSVREVVANALIHADYHGRQGIVIDKYPKRIEVSNPGILRISKAVAVAGGTSDARNAKIFNIFSLVKIGERSGMGLSQLYGNWEEAGYARPQLSESFNPERTKVEIEVEVAEKVAENRREYTEKPSEYTEKYTETRSEYTEKVTEKLSETEERIVALIQSNAHITQKMLSEAIGLTRQYVGRCMDSLQARKIIRRIGVARQLFHGAPRLWDSLVGLGDQLRHPALNRPVSQVRLRKRQQGHAGNRRQGYDEHPCQLCGGIHIAIEQVYHPADGKQDSDYREER